MCVTTEDVLPPHVRFASWPSGTLSMQPVAVPGT